MKKIGVLLILGTVLATGMVMAQTADQAESSEFEQMILDYRAYLIFCVNEPILFSV